jgi:pterin-4a-carbinolamine dehydratase
MPEISCLAEKLRVFQELCVLELVSRSVSDTWTDNVAFQELVNKKANQSHYKPDVPRVFQEVKVPRLRDNSQGR